MKNSALGKALLAFVVTLCGMMAFAAVGWYLDRPYRTNSFMVAISAMAAGAAMITAAGFGQLYLLRALNYSAFAAYLFGVVAFLNIMVFTAWKAVPYYGHMSVWVTMIAIVFAVTHFWRTDAYNELYDEVELRKEEMGEGRLDSVPETA